MCNLFPRATVTKYWKLGGLRQQKCILSQVRRPEVWSHSVQKVGSYWRLRDNQFRTCPWVLVVAGSPGCALACWPVTRISASSSRGFPPVYLFSSHKNTSLAGLRTHPTPVWHHQYLHVNYICKDLFPKPGSIYRSQGVRQQHAFLREEVQINR